MSDLGLFELDELPSDAYEDVKDILEFPKQRKLSLIRETLNSIEESGSVLVEDENYGITLLSGDLYFSDSSGSEQMMIAGIPVGRNKSTSKKTKEWEPLSNVKRVSDPLERSFGEHVSLDSLSHGDLVCVVFESPVYGSFAVLGVCTEGEKDSLLLVNKWIIREGSEREGLFYKEVRLIRERGRHDIRVPPRREPIVTKDTGEAFEL